MENQTNNKRYFYNVDFLRFIFSVIIVYFHIFSNIKKFYGDSIAIDTYKNLSILCGSARLIVDCFFIIAGFFLFQTILKNKTNMVQYVINRIARLWPVLAFSFLISVVFFKFKLYTAIINSLFLQCIGVTLLYKGINWYISPFFWVSIFYFYILKNFDKKYVHLIIAFCIYFGLMCNINYFDGGVGRETIKLFINTGVMRALSGIGIGYFIGLFYETVRDKIAQVEISQQVRDNVKEFFNKTIKEKCSFLIVSALEIYCFVFLINNFLFHKISYKNHLIFLIMFSVLFFCFLIKKGLLSKLLDNKYFAFCGKYAYSIYVMQQIAFNILKKTLWKNTEFVDNVPLCLAISVILPVIIGVLTYYLVEIPVGKKVKQSLEKLFISNH